MNYIYCNVKSANTTGIKTDNPETILFDELQLKIKKIN